VKKRYRTNDISSSAHHGESPSDPNAFNAPVYTGPVTQQQVTPVLDSHGPTDPNAFTPPASTKVAPVQSKVLRLGSGGSAVNEWQRLMGVAIDGRFGANTEAATKKFQSMNGLKVDGIVGPASWDAAMKAGPPVDPNTFVPEPVSHGPSDPNAFAPPTYTGPVAQGPSDPSAFAPPTYTGPSMPTSHGPTDPNAFNAPTYIRVAAPLDPQVTASIALGKSTVASNSVLNYGLSTMVSDADKNGYLAACGQYRGTKNEAMGVRKLLPGDYTNGFDTGYAAVVGVKHITFRIGNDAKDYDLAIQYGLNGIEPNSPDSYGKDAVGKPQATEVNSAFAPPATAETLFSTQATPTTTTQTYQVTPPLSSLAATTQIVKNLPSWVKWLAAALGLGGVAFAIKSRGKGK